MHILCILLLVFGACIMLYSIIKYYRSLVQLKTRMRSKKVLGDFFNAIALVLMLFFLAGYIFTAVAYMFNKEKTTADLLISLIFFFGAVFVLVMVTTVGRMFAAIMANEKLIMEKEAAEQASKSKGDFLSRMSHEMRTPMNAIIGMSAIGKKASENNRKDYCFDKIEAASSHLLGIINDILDMSKIEANKLELVNSDFNLNEMIERIEGMTHFQLENKNQHFIVSVAADVPQIINCDEQRLTQILTNLISNAIKFTPESGTISLIIKRKNDSNNNDEKSACILEFEVKDTGIGISSEQQKRLFNLFEQADGSISRRFGGTGLGLVISKRLVEIMGGAIIVNSKVGIGTSFIFSIRTFKNQQCSTNASSLINEAGLSEIYFENCFYNKRILVAEDVEINREIVAELLKFTGIMIDFAENGRIAYEIYTASPEIYNIIFMDINMPDMDGYEATRQIRNFEASANNSMEFPKETADKGMSFTEGETQSYDWKSRKRVPIIAMTANVFQDDIDKCIAAGMNGHIGKPLNLNEVITKIAGLG